MKLTYWKANCLSDSDVFSIRKKTRKAVQAQIDESKREGGFEYEAPHKVVIEYRNALELVEKTTGECGFSY